MSAALKMFFQFESASSSRCVAEFIFGIMEEQAKILCGETPQSFTVKNFMGYKSLKCVEI